MHLQELPMILVVGLKTLGTRLDNPYPTFNTAETVAGGQALSRPQLVRMAFGSLPMTKSDKLLITTVFGHKLWLNIFKQTQPTARLVRAVSF
jgi:hypothetical protein